jgi:SAM-dependent methyltransferase
LLIITGRSKVGVYCKEVIKEDFVNPITWTLNLGHDYSEPGFEDWEMKTWYPIKYFKRVLAKNIKELAGEGETVLSLGCGSSPILKMFNGKKVGVDIDGRKSSYIEDENTTFICADITKLKPFGAFDIVLLNEVIEHVGRENVNKVLELVVTSMKPGGRAVISMPNMDDTLGKLVENALHKEIHPSLFGIKDLILKCNRLGLLVTDQRHWLWDVALRLERR